MNELISHTGLMLTTVASVVVAFLLASRKARKKYGQEHLIAIKSGWLVLLLASSPLILHLALTKSSGDVVTIVSSSELALTATLIAFLGIMELCGAFAIRHTMSINPQRVQLIAAYVLLLFGAGLITSMEQMGSGSGSWVSALWNLCLLAWAVTSYFATGGVVRLVASRYRQA